MSLLWVILFKFQAFDLFLCFERKIFFGANNSVSKGVTSFYYIFRKVKSHEMCSRIRLQILISGTSSFGFSYKSFFLSKIFLFFLFRREVFREK